MPRLRRAVSHDFQVPSTVSPSRHPRAHTDHDECHVCQRRASGLFLLESLCQGATAACPCRLFRCAGDGHSMPLRPLASIGADGYTTAWRVCSSSMPSGRVTFLSLPSGPGYAISSPTFLSSDVQLQASVFQALDVETGGWGGSRHCCVQHHAVEDRGLSSVIKTRHHDFHLPVISLSR